jgi:[acyl-carrier-protein] S-malonyltransferase
MLPVSAPFHCSLMAPAAARLAVALREVPVGALRIPVVSNVEAAVYGDAGRVKELLERQVTSPVRWEESVRALAAMGVEEALELGPGTVLTGLCKRIAPEVRSRAAADPAQVRALVA